MRIGHGYDVHRFCSGRGLFLCGEEIDFNGIGLKGHSDADVAIHAICDALLGATGLGDIGRHFPDNDPEYKGISSMILLKEVNKKIKGKGYKPNNIDITIVAQKPKLAKYIDNMRVNIAKCLDMEVDMVNVKATTTEGLGFAGRVEGISSYCVCTVIDS